MTFPPVPKEEIDRFYPAEYYGAWNRRFNGPFEWLVARFRARRVSEIERRVPRGSVLDIGCGRGITLSLLAARGWKTAGVEVSETAAAQARAILGSSIHVGDFLRAPFAAGSFDAVVLWHVLEHLDDPLAVIRRCYEVLRPDGLLVVAVPNFESLQARLTGRHWFHLDIPRHYYHFRRSVLEQLLGSQGFRIEKTSHFSMEQDPYGWIQSLLNRAGFPTNLLYDLLKAPSARGRAISRHVGFIPPLLLALLAVVPLSLALFVLETVARRGGTVEIYARRESPST